MRVFTIGYEGLDIEGFIFLLNQEGIETIVDIRELPLSRKRGFSKNALSNTLSIYGLDYVHMADLGCPRSVRDIYRKDGNWKNYSKGFLAYLRSQKSSIAKLSELVQSSNCALLCFEADFNFCHRSMVANAVKDFCGANIKHIQTKNFKKENSASLSQVFV